MSHVHRLLARLHSDQSGQSNTEYALLVVVVLAIFGVILLVTQTNAPDFFGRIWERLMDAAG